MDKKYPLEAQLLARSHDLHKTVELLTERYAPPFISLDSTSQAVKKESIFKTKKSKKKSSSLIKKKLRKFIKKNKHLQNVYKQTHNEETHNKMIKYENYVELNKLWIEYIQDLLQINNSKPNKMILQKLSSIEFVGCFVNVLKSRNKDLIGKNGIILIDTMKFFIIIEDINEGQLKMIMKEGSVFNFIIPLSKIDEFDENDEVLEFSIIGSRICYRSDDRATRKFKSKASDDLRVLIE